jgi:hypothetical protein
MQIPGLIDVRSVSSRLSVIVFNDLRIIFGLYLEYFCVSTRIEAEASDTRANLGKCQSAIFRVQSRLEKSVHGAPTVSGTALNNDSWSRCDCIPIGTQSDAEIAHQSHPAFEKGSYC